MKLRFDMSGINGLISTIRDSPYGTGRITGEYLRGYLK